MRAAATRIAPFVHRTPVMTSASLDAWAGATLFLKCEHLQRVGAFKYRGATNAVQSLDDDEAARRCRRALVGQSRRRARARGRDARHSGVRRDARHRARAVKRAAVLAYGAEITACDNTPEARAATLAEVVARTGATEIHPFDDDRVIAGAGTAALELLEEIPDLDVVVAPVGGGGLLSGTALATHGMRPATRVDRAVNRCWPTTPRARWPPASCSRRSRRRRSPTGCSPASSERTFAIIREHVETIVTVTEAEIVDAMQTVWVRHEAAHRTVSRGRGRGGAQHALDGARVGVILSGGNVDLERDVRDAALTAY